MTSARVIAATAVLTVLAAAVAPEVAAIAPPLTPAPSAPQVGTATMQVIGGGAGPVTISYRINGGAEQTESNVVLPWEKQFPVYDEVESSVTAEAGPQALTCTITMNGMLASFKTEPHPTCSFAYYG